MVEAREVTAANYTSEIFFQISAESPSGFANAVAICTPLSALMTQCDRWTLDVVIITAYLGNFPICKQ